jgi:hypothetical protein
MNFFYPSERKELTMLKFFVIGGIAAAVLIGGGIAAISGATNSPKAATDPVTATRSPADPASTYLAIIEPANAELSRFGAKAKGWTSQTTGAQAASDAQPAIAAVREAVNELLRVNWPAPTATDIRAQARAFGALTGDLAALVGVTPLSSGSWVNQYAQDAGSASTASDIVRADLGLPPSRGA